MPDTVIGIGEFKISTDPDTVMKTYALGSCVCLIMYDIVHKIGGMIHVALPDSTINVEKSKKQPGYFADIGVPLLIEDFKKSGALIQKTWIKLIGGANVIGKDFPFNIGKRNILAIKKILWKYNLGVIAEEVGGEISRTVQFRLDSGDVMISNKGNKWTL